MLYIYVNIRILDMFAKLCCNEFSILDQQHFQKKWKELTAKKI